MVNRSEPKKTLPQRSLREGLGFLGTFVLFAADPRGAGILRL